MPVQVHSYLLNAYFNQFIYVTFCDQMGISGFSETIGSDGSIVGYGGVAIASNDCSSMSLKINDYNSISTWVARMSSNVSLLLIK